MSFSVNCCCCCYSAETLKKLSGPVLDVYMLICGYQGQKHPNNHILTCLRCREFLEEVHHFRIDCHEVDEDLDVKPHNIDLILRNAFSENSSKIDIKVEKVDDYDGIDEIDSQINKVEVHYDPESSEQLSEIPRESEQCNSTNSTKGNLLIEQNNYRPNIMTTNKHNEDKPFSCDQCNYSFKHRCRLITHKKTHLNDRDKPHKCNECSYTTISLNVLKAHIASKHSDERPYACDQCSNSFKLKFHLDAHKKTHLKARDKPHKCSECSFATTTLGALKRHVAFKHSDERPFSCDQCNNSYKLNYHLIAHKKTHLENHEKPHKCNECSYTATNMSSLKSHIAIRHTEEKPFSCDQCNSSFKLKYILDVHKKIHLADQDKPYKCKQCSYTTAILKSLKSHIASRHSDERPFSCDQCSYRSKRKAYLLEHKKTHSKDRDKSYKCDECSFKTTTMAKLRSHTAFKHSDERPYSCDLCGYRAKSKGHIYVHIQRHATEKDN